MKPLTVFLVFVAFQANCQIWKEPFDTLSYFDRKERLKGDQIGIKSYSVTRYSETDSILSYDFNGFNREGFLTEQFYAMYPNQHTDTNKYHYENGIAQGADFKREHIYNEKNRLSEIRFSREDSTWSTRYYYEDENLKEIRYSKLSWKSFQYDAHGELLRKEVFINGKLKEYFHYEHPDERTLFYQHCLIDDKGNSYLPCGVTEGYFDAEDRLVKIISKYDLDSNNVFITEFHFNKKGKLAKMTYSALHDPSLEAEDVFIRNRKGLLIRIEYFREGKLNFIDKFDYEYY